MFGNLSDSTNSSNLCTIHVSLFLKYVGTPIVVAGLIGNFLSTLVFSRKALRSRSCSIYFLALSLSDINVLFGYAFENLLFHGYGFQLLSNSWICKLIIFLIYASTDISNYLLTLAAIDRSVLVSESAFRHKFCRKSPAKLLVILVVVFFGVLNGHILFGFNVDSEGACVPISKNYRWFYVRHYDSYIDIIKTVLVPFILIFYCNSFIILTLARRRTTIVAWRPVQPGSRRRLEKDRQLTWFLLSTSVLFIILSLPAEINDFIRTKLNDDFQRKHFCQLWASTSLLILVQQTNHASHFYLYTLTGPIFRDEFRKLINFKGKSRTNSTNKVPRRQTGENRDRTELCLTWPSAKRKSVENSLFDGHLSREWTSLRQMKYRQVRFSTKAVKGRTTRRFVGKSKLK